MPCGASETWTRFGVGYDLNYDRHIVDDQVPLHAVIDSELDDGTAGDIVVRALLDARADLRAAVSVGPDAVQRVLVGALEAANTAIFTGPKEGPGRAGGASVTVCSRSEHDVVIAHVGDCRLYARERGSWVQRTTDHTLREALRTSVHELPDGAPSSELDAVGILLNAVGMAERARVETCRFSLAGVAALLLCTRGAWVPHDPTGDGIPLPSSTDETGIAAFIMDRYVENGERDNATVVVARIVAI